MTYREITDVEFAALPRTAFEIGIFKDVVREHEQATSHSDFCCKVAETYRVTLEAIAARKEVAIADNQVVRAPETKRTYGNGYGNPLAEKLASEAQVKYVRSLMTQRVITDTERKTWSLMLEGPMTSSQASMIINRLKDRALTAETEKAKATRMATDNQKKYVRSLLDTKVWEGQIDVDALTFDTVGELINALKAAPRKPRTETFKVEDGIYFYEGRYVKVQVACYGSGRRYTKVFDTETESWEREGNLLGKLKAEHKLTEAQASQFGALYGQCVRCSLPLTNEFSIEHGYGPVCASKMGF